METLFSKILITSRNNAGFPTAYNFYHKNGGRDVFKISFSSYMKIENGNNLPESDRLELFCCLLGIQNGSQAEHEFISAWLKTSFGDTTYNRFFRALNYKREKTTELSPMQTVLKKSFDSRTTYITPAQVKTIIADYESYLCYMAFTNDMGNWTVKELAPVLNIPMLKAQKIVDMFLRNKIFKKAKKGIFKNNFAGKSIEWPKEFILDKKVMDKVREYRKRMNENGKIIFERIGTFRADENELRTYLPVLKEHLNSIKAYDVFTKTDSSAMFRLESRITKLFKF
jgi:hypothetical protein